MTKVKAQAKWVRIGPRKLKRVVDLIRGKNTQESLNLLRFMPQKGARILEKLIKSAVANAKNNYKMSEEGLIVTEIFTNKAVVMRRFRARAKGRGFPIKKRNSHVTLYITGQEAS